jgi:hypothetical protein
MKQSANRILPEGAGTFDLLTAERHLVLFGRDLALPRREALAQVGASSSAGARVHAPRNMCTTFRDVALERRMLA